MFVFVDFQNCIQTVGVFKRNYPYSDVEAVRLLHHEEYSQVRFVHCLIEKNLYLLFTH